MNKKDVYSVTDRLGQREEKKSAGLRLWKEFRPGFEPGTD